MQRYQDHNGLLLLAHRGGAGEASENTIEAFQHAVALGFTHLETDVRATEDNVLYLAHDPTSRLPNRALKLKEGEPLLTLEELFTTLPNAFYAIDPKHDRVVAPLAELITKYDMVERVCIGSSFDYRTERTAKLVEELSGKRPCTALVSAGSLGRLLLSSKGAEIKQRKLHATYINVPKRLINERTINAAHNAGLKIIAWVLNDEESITAALNKGIDGFMTDYPSIAMRVVSSIEAE